MVILKLMSLAKSNLGELLQILRILHFNVNFEGGPQYMSHLKPYFHSKNHYGNVANSALRAKYGTKLVRVLTRIS